MFERLGEIVGALFVLGFGIAAFLKPNLMAGGHGPAEQVSKNVRFMKRCGLALILCGGASLLYAVFEFVAWLSRT